ncbi:MAG: outer membrane beta-barrel protein [Pseudomonadota bacterium]
MRTFLPWIALVLVPATALAEVAQRDATDEPETIETKSAHSFDASAGIGVEHDSNVAVLELDSNSGEADIAGLAELGLGYRYQPNDKATLSADYALSHTEYDEYSDYDLTIHRGTLDASYAFEIADAGVTYHHVDARLADERFLTMRRISPYVAHLFGDDLYLRGAYIRTDKSFHASEGRDATTDGVSADAFLFFNALKTYVSMGYQVSDEDADAPWFDYLGHQLTAQLTHKIPLRGRDLRLHGRVRYETRDYDSVSPFIGEARDDDRYRFDAGAALPIGERLTGTLSYEYADNRSNLPSVDFAEHVVSLRLDAQL